jgi:hypothetical protein
MIPPSCEEVVAETQLGPHYLCNQDEVAHMKSAALVAGGSCEKPATLGRRTGVHCGEATAQIKRQQRLSQAGWSTRPPSSSS